MIKKFLPLFFVVCTLILFLYRLWLPGFPYTHDGENHLARIANYALALRQGQIPPRWAPNLWAGYGYPVFNYNYPLANILAVPLLAVKVPVETTMKMLLTIGFVAGAFALWKILNARTSLFAATIGTIVWLTAPFTYTNLYVRGAIGEILAYSAFLWVLYSFDFFDQQKKNESFWPTVSVFCSIAALSLAHNVIALLLIPVVGMTMLWRFRPWKKYIVLFGVSLLSLLATTFFWIPALLEKNLVTLDSVGVSNGFAQHFPVIDELLTSVYQFGYSYPGPVDSLQFQIGVSVVLSCLLLVLHACMHLKDKHERTTLFLPIIGVFLIFLMLPVSTSFWKYLPFLHYVQFPWRLLGILTIVGGVASAYAMMKSPKILRWLLLFAVLISVISLFQHPAIQYFSHDDLYYRTFVQTTTVIDENRPRTSTEIQFHLSENMPILEKGVEMQIKQWNGSYRSYHVSSLTPHQVIEPTAYFLGWQTTVDGKKVAINAQKAGGLITFSVPKGDHNIVTKFTQWTTPRIIGNSLSLIAIGVFIAYVLNQRRKK